MTNSFLSGYNPNPPPELASKPIARVIDDSDGRPAVTTETFASTRDVIVVPAVTDGVQTLVEAVLTHDTGVSIVANPGPYKALPRKRPAAPVAVEPQWKAGAFITWKSQSGGYWKTKTGKILGVVSRLKRVAEALESIGCVSGTYSLRAQDTSIYDRYLIQVIQNGEKKHHLYAPNVSMIDACAKKAVDETMPSLAELSGKV